MTIDIEKASYDIARILVENGFFRRICESCKDKSKENHRSDCAKSLSFNLRGDCHALVKDVAEEWGVDEKIIYGKLKKIQGISQPQATDEQLSERVDILRDWLENGVD